jgi:hypothetical protein
MRSRQASGAISSRKSVKFSSSRQNQTQTRPGPKLDCFKQSSFQNPLVKICFNFFDKAADATMQNLHLAIAGDAS